MTFLGWNGGLPSVAQRAKRLLDVRLCTSLTCCKKVEAMADWYPLQKAMLTVGASNPPTQARARLSTLSVAVGAIEVNFLMHSK